MRTSATIVLMWACGCAHAQGAAVVVPPRQPPAAAAPARAGERGDVEIGLGVVTAMAAGVLIGLGSYEAWRGVQVRRYCSGLDTQEFFEYAFSCLTPLGGDPFVAATVSSSLSFAFAVPIAVASGFLLRRGIVTRRAWKASRVVKNMSVRPWTNGQNSAGLGFGLAF